MADIKQPCRQEAYRNIDPLIGAIISSGKATLRELKTVYTLEDAHDIFEIIAIDNYNKYLAYEYQEKKIKGGR